jgi:hypothetical protein
MFSKAFLSGEKKRVLGARALGGVNAVVYCILLPSVQHCRLCVRVVSQIILLRNVAHSCS